MPEKVSGNGGPGRTSPRLRGGGSAAIAPAMKAVCFLTLAAFLITSCRREPSVVTVTETRALTTKDVVPKLFATSDERFREKQEVPVHGDKPTAWKELAATQFRLLNYRFGEAGEVWVSLSAGSVRENVNRWLRQFHAVDLSDAWVAALRRVTVAGIEGVWVEAEGTYEGGMGSPPREGYALAGVVADISGRILTVKMVGPKAEVEAQKETLAMFAKSLVLSE